MRMAKTSHLEMLSCVILLVMALGCSARDFLTRRLAADLISASETFRAPQLFSLQTGIVSNKDYSSPDSLVLQRRGWIVGAERKCPRESSLHRAGTSCSLRSESIQFVR